MKRISKLLMLLCATGLAAACSNEGNEPVSATQPGAGMVNIKIVQNAATRGVTQPGTTNENALSSLEFYVFNNDGTPDDTCAYVRLQPGATYQFKVAVGNGKKVLAVANANMGNIGGNFTAVEQHLNQYVYDTTNSQGQDVAATNPSPVAMDMSGISEGWNAVAGQTANVQIHLARFAAKIAAPDVSGVSVDLTGLLQEDIDSIFHIDGTSAGVVPGSTYTFTYGGYALINGVQKSDLYDDDAFSTWQDATYYDDTTSPITTLYTNPQWDQTKGSATYGSFLAFPYSGSAVSGSTDYNKDCWLTATKAPYIYVYENKPIQRLDASGHPGFVSGTVYAFIMKGDLSVTTSTGSVLKATRYWRQNFYLTDLYNIQRNTVYSMTIKKIVTGGYPTPGQAAGLPSDVLPKPSEAAANFTIDVADWDVKAEDTQM
jgi:hypothetical protein